MAANENNVAKVVYVQNADVAGTGEVIFVLADQDAKKVNDTNVGDIREIKAVVGGEIVTLEIKQDTDAEDILTGADNNVNSVFYTGDEEGYLVDDTAGKQTRIVALESITYNSDGLVTDVRLYEGLNGDGDGYETYTQTEKASNGTVGLGDGNGNFDSFGWYDDAIGVRFDPKAEEFKLSRVSGIRDDYNDGVVAIFDSNVINGICVIEYEGSSAADQMTVSFNSGDYTVDGNTPANIYVDEGDDVSFTLGNVSGHKITAVTIDNVAQTLTGNAPYTFTLNDVTDDVVVNVTTEVDNSASLNIAKPAQSAVITIDNKPYANAATIEGYEAGETVLFDVTWGGNVDENAKIVMYGDEVVDIFNGTTYMINVDSSKTLVVGVETATLELPANVTATYDFKGVAGSASENDETEVPVGAEVKMSVEAAATYYVNYGEEYVTGGGDFTAFPMDGAVTVDDAKYHKVTMDDPAVTNGDSFAGLNTNLVVAASITGGLNEDGYVAEGENITITFTLTDNATGTTTTSVVNAVLDQEDGSTIQSTNFATAQQMISNSASAFDVDKDTDTVTIGAASSADIELSYTLS